MAGLFGGKKVVRQYLGPTLIWEAPDLSAPLTAPALVPVDEVQVEGGTVEIALSASGGTAPYTFSNPSLGAISGGALTIPLDSTFEGAVTFDVTDSSDPAQTVQGSVFVTISAPANIDPVTTGDTATVAAGDTVQIDALANDLDADGDALSITDASADIGSVTIGDAPGYLLTFDATGLAAGQTADITYTVSDGTDSIDGTVTVNVMDAAPVLSNLSTSGSPADTISIDVDKDCTVYYRLSTTSGQTREDVAAGGGLVSGSFVATPGSGEVELDFSDLDAGTYYLAVVARVDGGPLSNILEEEAVLNPMGPSVSFVSSALPLNSGSDGSSYTSESFFVGSGSDRCLVAIINGFLTLSGGPPTLAVTFAGEPMTVAISEDTVSGQKQYTAVAYLIAPPSGDGTLTIDATDADGVTPIDHRGMAAHLVDLSGVDQTNPIPTTASDGVGQSGGVTARSANIVTQHNGSLVISSLAIERGGIGGEIGVSGAAMLSGSPSETSSSQYGGVSFAAARRLVSYAGAEKHDYAWDTSDPAVAISLEIKAAS